MLTLFIEYLTVLLKGALALENKEQTLVVPLITLGIAGTAFNKVRELAALVLQPVVWTCILVPATIEFI